MQWPTRKHRHACSCLLWLRPTSTTSSLCNQCLWAERVCHGCRASNSLPSNVLAPAILYTAGSICIPSLASVYNEMALKKNMDTSVHVQNFFLYLFGLLFNLFGLFLLVVLGHQSISEVFKGHSKVLSLSSTVDSVFSLIPLAWSTHANLASGCSLHHNAVVKITGHKRSSGTPCMAV